LETFTLPLPRFAIRISPSAFRLAHYTRTLYMYNQCIKQTFYD